MTSVKPKKNQQQRKRLTKNLTRSKPKNQRPKPDKDARLSSSSADSRGKSSGKSDSDIVSDSFGSSSNNVSEYDVMKAAIQRIRKQKSHQLKRKPLKQKKDRKQTKEEKMLSSFQTHLSNLQSKSTLTAKEKREVDFLTQDFDDLKTLRKKKPVKGEEYDDYPERTILVRILKRLTPKTGLTDAQRKMKEALNEEIKDEKKADADERKGLTKAEIRAENRQAERPKVWAKVNKNQRLIKGPPSTGVVDKRRTNLELEKYRKKVMSDDQKKQPFKKIEERYLRTVGMLPESSYRSLSIKKPSAVLEKERRTLIASIEGRVYDKEISLLIDLTPTDFGKLIVDPMYLVWQNFERSSYSLAFLGLMMKTKYIAYSVDHKKRNEDTPKIALKEYVRSLLRSATKIESPELKDQFTGHLMSMLNRQFFRNYYKKARIQLQHGKGNSRDISEDELIDLGIISPPRKKQKLSPARGAPRPNLISVSSSH